MLGNRLPAFWMGLAVIGIAAGSVAGFAARQHTYTVRQLTAHWKAPYDLVVFPKGHSTGSSGLVDPNALDVGTGGITLVQYHQIQHLPGVAIAAPLAPLGSAALELAALNYPTPKPLPPGLYREAVQDVNAGLPNGQPLTFYQNVTSTTTPTSAASLLNQGLAMEVSLIAVNPTAEAALMGLRHAVVAGHYFTKAEDRLHPVTVPNPLPNQPKTIYRVPLLLTSVSPEAGHLVATIQRVTIPTANRAALIRQYPQLFGEGGTVNQTPALRQLTGHAVERASIAYSTLWHDVLADLFRYGSMQPLDGYPATVSSKAFGVGASTNYYESGALSLTQTASPYPKRWRVALVARPVQAEPLLAFWKGFGEPFRRATVGDSVYSTDAVPIGIYDPVRLHVADDPLTHLPLVGYRPETGTEVVSAAGTALNPLVQVLPDGSPEGLWTAPPEALVPLSTVTPLLGPAPISSIRIRVSGVRALGSGGEARLLAVAREITRATGLPVTIMRGTSPEQILLHPGHLKGFAPMGWIQTEWVRLGASVEILRQVSLSQSVMLGPVLVAAALFAGVSAWLGLAGDRRRWAVALAVGVPPRVVWQQLVRQAGIQGLGVAVLAVATAGAIGHGPAFVLAAPVGLAAALVVVGAMAPAARMVARQDPVRGLKPEPPAGMARLTVATGAQLGWALAGAAWHRLWLAVLALMVPAAVTYGVGLVQ
ncbi:MAG: hypothetical protein ACP5QO_12690, partial [Clostridia bacterium]